MSTTGNEFEQPGVNYPDRDDAAGATPSPGDDTRAAGPDVPPTSGGHLEAAVLARRHIAFMRGEDRVAAPDQRDDPLLISG